MPMLLLSVRLLPAGDIKDQSETTEGSLDNRLGNGIQMIKCISHRAVPEVKDWVCVCCLLG